MSNNEINENLKQTYINKSLIKASPVSDGNTTVSISPYTVKPKSGYCDWCSGKIYTST